MPPETIEKYHCTVEPQWIDYNGHMNVAYYVLLFDRATDQFLDHFGIGGDYRRRTDHSLYVLEMHTAYKREVKEGDRLVIETFLAGADSRRIHLFHRMTQAEAGYEAATNEILGLHVDLAGPRAAALPPGPAERLARLAEAQRGMVPADELGRGIGLDRKRRAQG